MGGVGKVCEGGNPREEVDAVAPGQYEPACAAWICEISRKGNLYLDREDCSVGSNGRGFVK